MSWAVFASVRPISAIEQTKAVVGPVVEAVVVAVAAAGG